MTLDEFTKEIIGEDIHKFSQEEIEYLFKIAPIFSSFVMKKWKDSKIVSNTP